MLMAIMNSWRIKNEQRIEMDLDCPGWIADPGGDCRDRICNLRWIWIQHDGTRFPNDATDAILLQPGADDLRCPIRPGSVRINHRRNCGVSWRDRARQPTHAEHYTSPNGRNYASMLKLWQTSTGRMEDLSILREPSDLGQQLCADSISHD